MQREQLDRRRGRRDHDIVDFDPPKNYGRWFWPSFFVVACNYQKSHFVPFFTERSRIIYQPVWIVKWVFYFTTSL